MVMNPSSLPVTGRCGATSRTEDRARRDLACRAPPVDVEMLGAGREVLGEPVEDVDGEAVAGSRCHEAHQGQRAGVWRSSLEW
jgi:hypothetical protein